MRQVIVSIVVGLAVAVVAGWVATAFLFAATWVGIHAGLSEITLVMFSLGAFAFQLTLGLLVVGGRITSWARDGELRLTRLYRSHQQAELSGAIAQATFEAKGWT